MLLNVLGIILTYLVCYTSSARILGLFHIPGYSHQALGVRLFQELAERGHEITFVTSTIPKTPIKNVKIVPLKIERQDDGPKNLFEFFAGTGAYQTFMYDVMGIWITEAVLNQTNLQDLLKSDQKFDLIIMEQFLNEGFRGLCHHYKAPCILFSTIGASRWTNAQMGNPAPPSYVPEMLLNLPSEMTFLQRVFNVLTYASGELFAHFYTLRKHNSIVQKFFPGAPHIHDLYYNTSLMLLNSHVSINAPVPYVPNMIEIGGFHVSPPKKLPEDLQAFLDNTKQGVVYFSMGSHLKSNELPADKLEAVVKSLGKLKEKVLWKWEDQDLPNKPVNVNVSAWFPQQDLLAHPNIKLFITHGGLLSTIESIYHGVPLVGIPIFGDQRMNMANSEYAGFARCVPYSSLTEQTLTHALKEVLENPKYTENARRRSEILRDRPMKPIDTAVYWVEYVIRHRGAPHLRTAAVKLAWYQYFMLDVVLFVTCVLCLIVYVLVKLVKKCCWKRKTDHKKVE